MIKELTLTDFENFFAIWKQGLAESFSDEKLSADKDEQYYKSSFKKKFAELNSTYKVWGYFEVNELLGWVAILPCQAGPFVERNYGQMSLYINANSRNRNIGQQLIAYALNFAEQQTPLCYIIAYVSPLNNAVIKLVTEAGYKKVGSLPHSANDPCKIALDYWVRAL